MYISHHYGPRWHGRWIRHIWSTVRTCAHIEISLFEKTYVFAFFFIFSQSTYVELFFFILLCFLSPILFVSLRHALSHFLSVQVSYFVPVFTHQINLWNDQYKRTFFFHKFINNGFIFILFLFIFLSIKSFTSIYCFIYTITFYLPDRAIANRERKRKIALAPPGIKSLKDRRSVRKLRAKEQNIGKYVLDDIVSGIHVEKNW